MTNQVNVKPATYFLQTYMASVNSGDKSTLHLPGLPHYIAIGLASTPSEGLSLALL